MAKAFTFISGMASMIATAYFAVRYQWDAASFFLLWTFFMVYLMDNGAGPYE